MTDVEATYDDFVASRRSGRRNAVVHDLPGSAGAPDLSENLAQLNISKSGDDAEKSQDSPEKEKETQAEDT